MKNTNALSAKEAYELSLVNYIIVDIREPYLTDSKQFNANDTIFIPLSKIYDEYKSLPTIFNYIIADASGMKAKEVSEFLINQGYSNILYLAGGIIDWEKCGLPVIIDKSNMYSGSCLCKLRQRNKQ